MVVHQPDERRNDKRQQFVFGGKINRGDLEDDGLARARRCRDENVAEIFSVHAQFDLLNDIGDDLFLRNGNGTFDAAAQFLQVVHRKIPEDVVTPMPLQNFGVSVPVLKAELELFGAHAEKFLPRIFKCASSLALSPV